jgi:four helix bundle protein
MFLFEKLIAYQKSIDLTTQIYVLTRKWPKTETYALTDQIKRSASSISLNIAEGNSRTNKDFRHFLTIARGSCYECVASLHIAVNLGYISTNQYSSLYVKFEELSRIIQGLQKSLQ